MGDRSETNADEETKKDHDKNEWFCVFIIWVIWNLTLQGPRSSRLSGGDINFLGEKCKEGVGSFPTMQIQQCKHIGKHCLRHILFGIVIQLSILSLWPFYILPQLKHAPCAKVLWKQLACLLVDYRREFEGCPLRVLLIHSTEQAIKTTPFHHIPPYVLMEAGIMDNCPNDCSLCYISLSVRIAIFW